MIISFQFAYYVTDYQFGSNILRCVCPTFDDNDLNIKAYKLFIKMAPLLTKCFV